jgi:uncharacterized OsmC-like protein
LNPHLSSALLTIVPREYIRKSSYYHLNATNMSAQDAATAMRAKQAPLKSKYREDPASALVTLSSSGSLDPTNLTCSLGGAAAQASKRIAGMHAAAGGNAGIGAPDVSSELCSGDMLLESLVACFGVTVRAVGTSMGIPLHGGTVTAEGDLDFRGTLGIKDADGGQVGVGFQKIKLVTRLDVDEQDKGKVEKLIQLSERYCVVLQTLRQGVTVETQIGHVGKPVPDVRKDSAIGERADGQGMAEEKLADEEVLQLN